MKPPLLASSACLLGVAVVIAQAATELPRKFAGVDMVTGESMGSMEEGMLVACGKAFLMILATELGDETFIIAAIMSMRHSRLIVYAGAMTALIFMTVISTVLGFILPNLISRQATQHAASLLYTIFGVRLLWIAWRSSPQETSQDESDILVQEEVEEVQEKLKQSEQGQQRSGATKFFAHFVTPALLEALVLTFIAEWGDRSQIATITLAATYNPYGVTAGAIVGHALCTGTAVLGGKLLAMKISQRTVACVGGLLFLAFAVHNIFSAWIQ